jgi:hypothetical protein
MKTSQIFLAKVFAFTISVGIFLSLFLQILIAPSVVNREWKAQESDFNYNNVESSLIKQLTNTRSLEKTLENDSIYLVISLIDSSVAIGVKGVSFYTTKIHSYDIDPLLTSLHASVYLNQFQKPISFTEIYSSIIKEPIKVKIAPKNAEEAAKMVTLPDSMIFEPAHISYRAANGLNINLKGKVKHSLLVQLYSSLKQRLSVSTSMTQEMLKASASLEPYQHQPKIDIILDNVDLTSIYRALSCTPKIVVQF